MATKIKTIINSFLKNKKKEILLKNSIEKSVNSKLESETQKHISLRVVSKNKIVLYADSSIVGYKIKLLKNIIFKEVIKQHPSIKEIIIKIKNGN